MSNALTIAVQSMQNDLSRLDAISQNAANINTPGYRRTITTSTSFADVLSLSRGRTGAGASLTLPSMTSAVDTTHGALKATGNPLDLALDGEGYFELSTPTGPAYVRTVSARLDEQGRLVNQAGLLVNGTGGDIVADGSNATIGPRGEVLVHGEAVAHLRVVRFDDPHALEKTPDGLLRPKSANATPQEAATVQVRSGFLEGSNVTPLNEMVAMLETSRHFESQQKLFQGYDEQLSNAIQHLGQF
jgi:flagellar basal-body rod protein FlgG